METRGVIHGHFAKLTSAKNFLYPSITEFPLATASSMPLTCHEKPNIVVRNIRCQWGVEQYDSYYPGPWKYLEILSLIYIYIRIYASTGWHYSRILIVYVIFDNTPAASLCPVHNFLDHVSGSLKLFFLLLQVILNGFTQALRPCHGCSLDHVLVAYVVWWDAGSSSFEWRFSTKMARRPDKKWITNAKEVYTAGCNPEKRCGPNYLLCGQCGLWSI